MNEREKKNMHPTDEKSESSGRNFIKRKQKNRTLTRWVFTAALLAAGVLLSFALGFFLRPVIWSTGGQGSTASKEPSVEEQEEKKPTKWTCSMHPQIKLPKPGKCPICFMSLIPLDQGSGGEGSMRELSVSKSSAKLMEIQTAPVERRFVTAEVRMVGKIDYDETRVSSITAWVPGRLDRLFVDYTGVSVKKGDHMVSLYSPELLVAQEELLQAVNAAKTLEKTNRSVIRETTEATVEAAREKLRLWGLTDVQIKEIEQRGTADDHVTIYAPAGGIVVDKNAQEGMYVSTGTRIYTIADLSRVWINLDAYESDLAWLRYGQTVQFTTESYPGEMFTGTISFIHPVLNEATRTVKIRVTVSNDDGRLKPGMFVRAVVESEVATGGRIMDAALAGKWISPMHPEVVKDGPGTCDVCGMPLVRAESLGYVGKEATDEDKPLVIPVSAPLLTGKRAVVYVEVPDREKPTFEGREIVLGPRTKEYYLVKRGLKEGDRVVTKGGFTLDAELQIQAKPSMMTPGGGSSGGGHAHHSAPEKETGDEDQEKSGSGVSLSAVVRSQMHDAIKAGLDAIQASSGKDLDRIRDAYGRFQVRVEAVDGDTLSGHAGMLWKEYSMLLGNDSAEGGMVTTKEEAVNVAEKTKHHIEAMQAKFGLMHKAHKAEKTQEISSKFMKQLGKVVARYLDIHAALAGDDTEAALGAASQALEALANVDMNLVTGKDHTGWMEHMRKLTSLLKAVSGAEGIEPARAKFALLSEQMTATLKRFGVPEGTLYKAWCPMAFDNRGAWWIQGREQISNPYFGATMLRCGEIKEVLK